ncbi:ABC transporter permease subunit, partial [Bacillus sp. JJ722]|uniref:ABC transporter permease subunit n=1 Tax=Bacillus sp. JJ722 TaxID=3122973 RepID=UPI002FFE6F30
EWLLMKNKTVLFFISLLLLLFISSVIYNVFFIDSAEKTTILYDDNGEVIKGPPYPPTVIPPFGTDRGGDNIALRLLGGFQYTFLFVIVTTLIRILFGGLLSYLLVFPLNKTSKWIQLTFVPFTYFPAFILVLYFTGPLNFISDIFTFWELILLQAVIVILVGIPVITNTITNEMRLILKNDFIKSASTLGASNGHIFFKHIIPVLKSRFLLITLQQTTISFILLLHLGAFGYYIGGGQKSAVNEEGRILSMSGEWGGMIGEAKVELTSGAPWIFFIPLAVATLLLICINISIKKLQNK